VEFEKKLEDYSTGGMTTEEQYKSALIDVAQLLNHRKDNGTKYNLDNAKEYYLDPRITFAWCHRFHVRIECVYSEGLITKFKWAFNTSAINYKFAE
jgi:DNA topoisomerase-1